MTGMGSCLQLSQILSHPQPCYLGLIDPDKESGEKEAEGDKLPLKGAPAQEATLGRVQEL